MPLVLILHSSIDGHTVTLCDRVRDLIAAHGLATRRAEITACDEAMLHAADMVVIGASIRYGYHRAAVGRFMRQHRAFLEQHPTAFFSVNLVARKAGKDLPDTNPYARKFLRRLGWRPRLLAVFAGRLDYPRCGFFDRQAIRFIMWMTGGPTDPHSVTEFTDWTQVDAFGEACAGLALPQD